MSIWGKPALTGLFDFSGSGPIVSFPYGDGSPLKSLVAHIEPVQSGSGDPSPDNVRPISGWTGCDVWRTGKNLFDASVLTEMSSWQFIDLPLVAGTYTFSCTIPEASQLRFYFRKSDGTSGSATRVYSGHPVKVTLVDGETAVVQYRRASGDDVFSNYLYQLELGTTPTAYEPYSGDTYAITFPTEAGTVYGGTLDVTNGVLTVDRANIASYNGETLPGEWISDRDVYAPGITPTIGAQVVYTLAAPITYQLTPQQINTLIGENNIWADTGDVDVEYSRKTLGFLSSV